MAPTNRRFGWSSSKDSMWGRKNTWPSARAAGRCWKTMMVTSFLGARRNMLAPSPRDGLPASGVCLGLVGAAQLGGDHHRQQPVFGDPHVGALEGDAVVEQALGPHD